MRSSSHHRLSPLLRVAVLVGLALAGESVAAPTNMIPIQGALVFQSLPEARFSFDGMVGRRVEVNLDQWLLRAPAANPGMLEMFRLRDRQPEPKLVPWAGEFAGKYLISAIQALRMDDRPALKARVEEVVRDLISSQAEDGYLGPFPKAERLTGNW